jgi:hypothetical protein
MRLAAAAALGLAACAARPPDPAELLVPRSGAAAAVQERRFEGVSAQELSQAAVQVLQDSSFLVTASEPALGLIVGTRGGTLKSPGEMTHEILRAIGDALTFNWVGQEPARAKYAPAGVSVVVSVTPAASGCAVRVAFHRVVTDGGANLLWVQELPGPEPHQKFFALLAQALSISSRSPAPATRAPGG